MSKFCYLGDTLGSGGGVVEAARARVRCAWAKFKELSPILTVRGASYRIKGRIYSACVQSVLINGDQRSLVLRRCGVPPTQTHLFD